MLSEPGSDFVFIYINVYTYHHTSIWMQREFAFLTSTIDQERYIHTGEFAVSLFSPPTRRPDVLPELWEEARQWATWDWYEAVTPLRPLLEKAVVASHFGNTEGSNSCVGSTSREVDHQSKYDWTGCVTRFRWFARPLSEHKHLSCELNRCEFCSKQPVEGPKRSTKRRSDWTKHAFLPTCLYKAHSAFWRLSIWHRQVAQDIWKDDCYFPPTFSWSENRGLKISEKGWGWKNALQDQWWHGDSVSIRIDFPGTASDTSFQGLLHKWVSKGGESRPLFSPFTKKVARWRCPLVYNCNVGGGGAFSST